MKISKIIKILIAIVLLFTLASCTKEKSNFQFTQDGNFLVYIGEIETTETSFPLGTRLIVKVREDVIEPNKMIDKVFINSVGNEAKYQYYITVDKNISLRVTFKDIPGGSTRVSITGSELEIEPYSPDNVYEIGSTITLKAPRYYRFNSLLINDKKVLIDSAEHVLVVERITKIRVQSDSLQKTHDQVRIISPNNRPVTIKNSIKDGYYLIGSQITLLAPENYSFSGTIMINGREVHINGASVTIIVEENMTINFSSDNIVLNSFEIELLNDNITIISDHEQSLYAHGTLVYIKASNGNGLEIIDKLIINGNEIEVNSAIYELIIEDNLVIDATFKPYSGEYDEIQISTADSYHLNPDETVLSQALNVHMFSVDFNDSKQLVFQRASEIKARIDHGSYLRYVMFIVKYEVEDVKIYQNGFGFINRHEVMYVGSDNEFSIQLEISAVVPNLENLSSPNHSRFIVRSDQVGNLSYSLEENGLDVTGEYLNSKNALLFNSSAIGKQLNLVINSEEGIKIVQPIKVVKGMNVYTPEQLLTAEVSVIQNNLLILEPITILNNAEIIGNYHQILFDVSEGNLITINSQALKLGIVMLKSKYANPAMIMATHAKVELDNVVIENTRFGIHAYNSDVLSRNSKYQNIEVSNIVSVNDQNATANVDLEIILENNIFLKSQKASILIVDLFKESSTNETPEEIIVGEAEIKTTQTITLLNNSFQNIKTDPTISNESLSFLETINPEFVSREPFYYNLAVSLDGGLIYQEYFTDIELKQDPKCIIK